MRRSWHGALALLMEQWKKQPVARATGRGLQAVEGVEGRGR